MTFDNTQAFRPHEWQKYLQILSQSERWPDYVRSYTLIVSNNIDLLVINTIHIQGFGWKISLKLGFPNLNKWALNTYVLGRLFYHLNSAGNSYHYVEPIENAFMVDVMK